ncbi:alkene reductase [Corynebacterium sp. YIM 101645]|uniref:Alkene reductase n=1 Tax=Corynebacterium lemuris TaxID=1859292 RepID=A0ABT2FSM8_9CORY|nr:alkene reductase [Corynebacterium lemuris]MCS5478121.1 alkene reductase [Corynebacterium lemuris]
MSNSSLFSTFQLGTLELRNRTVMAPLTRSRATPDGVPTELMEIYYAQRAGAGLIISEGVVVSPQGVAYPRVPGLYNDEQIAAWRRVTGAVHGQGGKIFAQLWHVGRQSHSSVQPDGLPPFAPSPVRIEGYQYYRKPDRLPYETPRQLSREGIRKVIEQYAQAAARAVDAGFDGVEIHAANGYLIDQFLNSGSNQRWDEYGGSPANRARFLHELLDAVGTRVPPSLVGVRLSPSSTWMDAFDEDKTALHSHVVASLNRHGLAYLHLVEPEIAGSITADVAADAVPTEKLAALFHGPVIVTGEHNLASAQQRIEDGVADLVGFGRTFIANPDLPERLRTGAPLNPPEKRTFYAGGAEGYITYPSLTEGARWAELRSAIEAGTLSAEDLLAELSARNPVELARSGGLHSLHQLRELVTSQTTASRT